MTGDLADKATLARAFAEHDIVAVMHFAASSLVGESVADPQKYYLNNLAGTLSLLEAMREAGCNRLVFSSTGAVYGNADSKALAGKLPLRADQSLWRLEMDDRARAGGLSHRLWARIVRAALFQRQRRRCRPAASASCATTKPISSPAP